ncbi:DUF6174 domain-containing protein [Actinoplanes sp. NPDC023714]|uniref:DUF6174 domain-containing protein n=1 Tax=Actinoplanes sp. NPDC023714 TaxID=3154322 RepID=UPI0033CDE5F3
MGTGSRLLAAAVLLAIPGCGSPATTTVAPPVVPSYTSASEPVDWVEPRSYAFTLTTGCTRGFSEARYRVAVRDGRVSSSVPLNEQASANATFQAPTLGDLDEWITSADLENPGIRRDRDPVDGHPVAFGFDQKAMAYDGGMCFAVSDYSA